MTLITWLRTSLRLIHAFIWIALAMILMPMLFIPKVVPEKVAKAGFNRIPDAYVRHLCRRLCACFNVEVRYFGQPAQAGSLLVPNHISWLDILVLSHKDIYAYVAKSEVRKWPLFGAIGAAIGTLYINRTSKFSVYRSLPSGEACLKKKKSLVVFPEGTTSVGETMLHVYPMTYEIAVRQCAKVQPIALRYLNQQGERSMAAPFVDDDTFLGSLLKTAMEKYTLVEVHFLPELHSKHLHRKQLAKATKDSIDQCLSQNGETLLMNPTPTESQF